MNKLLTVCVWLNLGVSVIDLYTNHIALGLFSLGCALWCYLCIEEEN